MGKVSLPSTEETLRRQFLSFRLWMRLLSRSSHPDTLGSETEDGGRPRSHHGKWEVKGSRVL